MKTTLLTLSVAAVISLTGCGGSGSNNSQPASDAKTVIKIGNESAFDFASVTIKNRSGATLYESPFKCISSDVNCFINLYQDINESVTLLFKDSSGKLVRAVIIADAPGSYITLYPSALSTGIYLMQRLDKDYFAKEGINWEELNLRVATFFANYDSPDGTVDPYQEVGLYYSSRINKGVVSEEAFLNEFKQRLLNWDVAKNDELPMANSNVASLYQRFYAMLRADGNPLIRPAFAQEASCGNGLTTFLSIAENLGSVIPIVGDGVAGAAGIASSYCDGTDAKLDKIESQLNDLQTSVDTVNLNLSKLTNFISQKEINERSAKFQEVAYAAKGWATHYKDFLKDNGNAKSLQAYFASKGGWDQAIAAGGVALHKLLQATYEDPDNGMFKNIRDTTANDNFKNYLQALTDKCGALTESSEYNFIATRQQCNNNIISNTARLVAAQGMMLPIIKDVYTTLDTYKDKAKNTYLLPAGAASFDKAYTVIKTDFDRQQTDLINTYKTTTQSKDGYFDAFKGLELTKSLVANQCMQEGKDRKTKPAIVGWYQTSSLPKDNYIETECRVGNTTQRIKARYYYNDQGSVNANDVANVLGVPVAYDYVKNDWPLYNSNANITSERFIGVSQIVIESPKMLHYGEGSDPIIQKGSLWMKPSASNPNLFSYPMDTVRRPIWAVFPAKTTTVNEKGEEIKVAPYYHVAKFSFREVRSSTDPDEVYSNLTCVAAPCRVDPKTGEWLIFTDDQETLDLWKLNNGNFRLAPVGQ